MAVLFSVVIILCMLSACHCAISTNKSNSRLNNTVAPGNYKPVAPGNYKPVIIDITTMAPITITTGGNVVDTTTVTINITNVSIDTTWLVLLLLFSFGLGYFCRRQRYGRQPPCDAILHCCCCLPSE